MKINNNGTNVTGEIRSNISFEDFAPVFKVFEGYPFCESWSTEAMLREYNSFQVQDGIIFGYYLDGKCVGILTFRPLVPGEHPVEYPADKKVMYLSDVATLYEYRGRGIGTHLLHHGSRHLEVLGYDYIYLRTNESDSMVEPIAAKCGFKRIWDLCEEVERPRIDGTVGKDLRMFMEKKLR